MSKSRIWLAATVVIVGGWMAAFSNVLANELFPVSPQVQHRVNFWIKVFTIYGRQHVIIHDNDHLNVIYDVVDLGDTTSARRSRWSQVEATRQEVRAALQKLSLMTAPIDTLTLNQRQRQVYRQWAFRNDPGKFAKAAQNIHLQAGVNQLFLKGLVRSGRYLDTMMTVFRQYGLPEDLCYLPHVESAFNYRAYSKLGAAGIWQFTRSTGRIYLKIDYAIDERFDPWLATEAAAKLMRHNYSELQSWPLAITAYNHGKGGMLRAKKQLNTDDLGTIIEYYNGRAFGFASKNFYAEFLAARQVAKNYQRYFPDVPLEKPSKYLTFEVPSYITYDALVKKFKLDRDLVAELNPSLRRPILKSTRRIPQGFKLRLPHLPEFDPQALYAQLPAAEKFDSQISDRYYRVEPGDNLGLIARQFGTTVETLMDLNDISNPRRLRAGQLLELPIPASGAPTRIAVVTPPAAGTETGAAAQQPAREPVTGTQETVVPPPKAKEKAVAPPDTSLLALARAQAGNGKSIFGPIQSGQKMANASGVGERLFEVNFEMPVSNTVVVQPEETIGHFAEWLGLPAQRLRQMNQIAYSENLQLGDKLTVDFAQVPAAEFHRRRLEYHRSIQEDFFTNYRIDSTRTYVVKSGDNMWYLCNRVVSAPVWLLQRLNKNQDLLRLYPGQELQIPVLTPLTESSVLNQE